MIRLRIPLIPVGLDLQFSGRTWRESLPRVSMRSLLLLIAVVAVLMGSYVALVEKEKRKQRYLAAERRIDRQIQLLRGATKEAMRSDRETEEMVIRDLASIEKEEQEAKKWPESSDKRELHLLLASQWRTELAKAAKRLGWWADAAEAFRSRESEILEERKKISNDLIAIERLALDAEKLPESPLWKKNRWADMLAEIKARPDLEAFDPEVIKATAIDQAKGMLKATHPNIDPDRLTIEAKGRQYAWTIAFTDPKSKQTYPINCYFGRSVVDSYITKQEAKTRRNMFGFRWP